MGAQPSELDGAETSAPGITSRPAYARLGAGAAMLPRGDGFREPDRLHRVEFGPSASGSGLLTWVGLYISGAGVLSIFLIWRSETLPLKMAQRQSIKKG